MRVSLGSGTMNCRRYALVVACAAGVGCRSHSPPSVAQLTGCYQLQFGSWEPPLKNYQLPITLELRDTVILAPQMRQVILSREPTRGAWQLDSNGVVEIWLDPPWPAGVKLLLRPHGKDLTGRAEYFADQPVLPAPAASVTAQRAECHAAA